MSKKLVVIFMGVLLCSLFNLSSVFSQDAEKEQIVSTTYYPAPFGDYDELQADSMAVGDGVAMPADGGLAVSNINVGGAMSFMPSAQPDTAAEGMIYYDSTSHKLKFFDGSNWKEVGSAGNSGIRFSTDPDYVAVDAADVGTDDFWPRRAVLVTPAWQEVIIDPTSVGYKGAIISIRRAVDSTVQEAGARDLLVDIRTADTNTYVGRVGAQDECSSGAGSVRRFGGFAIVPLENRRIEVKRINFDGPWDDNGHIVIRVVALIS